jgi:hypothetical protein
MSSALTEGESVATLFRIVDDEEDGLAPSPVSPAEGSTAAAPVTV